MEFPEIKSQLWCAHHAVEVAQRNLADALEALREARLQSKASQAMLESITPAEKEAGSNE
jgi:hypothetical protein